MLKRVSALVILGILSACSQSLPVLQPQLLQRLPQQTLPQTRAFSYTGLYQIARNLFHSTFVSKDANSDGKLTQPESGLDGQAFRQLDLNKDQFLNEAEMFPPKMYWDFIQSMRELAQEDMEKHDMDKDGQLDFKEFKPYAGHFTENTPEAFKEYDKNANGLLNMSEFEDFVGKAFSGQRFQQFISQIKR